MSLKLNNNYDNYEENLQLGNTEIINSRIEDTFKGKIDSNFLLNLRKIFEDNNLPKEKISTLIQLKGKEKQNELKKILKENNLENKFIEEIEKKTNKALSNIDSSKINFNMLTKIKLALSENGYGVEEINQLFSKLDLKGKKNKKEIRESLKTILKKEGLNPALISKEKFQKTEKTKSYLINQKLNLVLESADLSLNKLHKLKKQKNEVKQAYLNRALSAIQTLDNGIKIGLNSPKYKKETIKKFLLIKSSKEQEAFLRRLKKLEKKEAEGFVALKETVTIAGIKVNKFCNESYDQFINHYYRNAPIEEKEMCDITKIVKNEYKLLKELEHEYGNKKGLLSLAIKSFSELGYQDKVNQIKEYKNTKNQENSKEILLNKAIKAVIEKASKNKLISNEDKRALENYFKNEENFKNKKTNDKNDINEKEKAFNVLTSRKEHKEIPTIIKFTKQKEIFEKVISKLEKFKSHSEKVINKNKELFTNLSFQKKSELIKNLEKEIAKKEKENNKKERKEKENEEKEQKEEKLNFMSTLKEYNKLISSDQPQEALDILSKYNREKPGNKKILFFMNQATQYMMQFSIEEKFQDESQNKNFQNKLKKETNKESIKNETNQINTIDTNLKIAKKNEEKFNSINAINRIKEEELRNEKSINQKEYKKNFIEENKSKIEKDQITNINIEQQLDDNLIEKTKIYTTEKLKGIKEQNIQFKDNSGNNISTKRAKEQLEDRKNKLLNSLIKKTTDHNLKNRSNEDRLKRQEQIKEIEKELFN